MTLARAVAKYCIDHILQSVHINRRRLIPITYQNKVICTVSQMTLENSMHLCQSIADFIEKLMTRLRCPHCSSEQLVQLIDNEPGKDIVCLKCRKYIEVKSILQRGATIGGYDKDKKMRVKLGACSTYNSFEKKVNTRLVCCWYVRKMDCGVAECTAFNCIESIQVQQVLGVCMHDLVLHENCETVIVKQKKTSKVVLIILPSLYKHIKFIQSSEFTVPISYMCERQNIIETASQIISISRSLNKKMRNKKKRLRIKPYFTYSNVSKKIKSNANVLQRV
jgi:hypothetical protein